MSFSYYSDPTDVSESSDDSSQNEWTIVKEKTKVKSKTSKRVEKVEEFKKPIQTDNKKYNIGDYVHFFVQDVNSVVENSGTIVSSSTLTFPETSNYYVVEMLNWIKTPTPPRDIENPLGPARYIPTDIQIVVKNRCPNNLSLIKYIQISEDEVFESYLKIKKIPVDSTLREVLINMWKNLIFRRVNVVDSSKGVKTSELHPYIENGKVVFKSYEVNNDCKNLNAIRYDYYYGFTHATPILNNDKYAGNAIFFDSRDLSPLALPDKFGMAEFVEPTELGLILPRKNSYICGLVEIGDKGKPVYKNWFNSSPQFLELYNFLFEKSKFNKEKLITGQHLPYMSGNEFDDKTRLSKVMETDFNLESCALTTTDIYVQIAESADKKLKDVLLLDLFSALRWLIPNYNDFVVKSDKEKEKVSVWTQKSKVQPAVTFAKALGETNFVLPEKEVKIEIIDW